MTDPVTRRTFLGTALLTAGALQVSPQLFSQIRSAASYASHPVMTPVDFSQVKISDSFWYPKQKKVATATLSACIYQTEQKTGRIRNFEKVARRQGEAHEGIYYDDSDVYKALEAIAYSLRNRPDPQLEAKADEWIDKVAAAQLDDGYLDTYVTLKGLDRRWTDMEKHEDYCAGHLIEAAIAYYRTTGKRKLLDVAIRLADHIDQTFRLSNRHWVSGHEEIELALMKLFHLTGNDRYLKLAAWYLEQRGHGYGRGALWGEGKNLDYCQDRLPVKQQRDIVGHAVRAMYLYSAVADVAAVTGDAAYMETMDAVWEDVVSRNLYITGGIGSSGDNEGFT
ncbi:MAG TPA: beta-L-arabinofuranosidase domain-containing protein, partial [Bryobacteraceae bacterium]|nr:beta-L-arabinofuranosidase domain-containing protein [Bryobacteraceae bacterium]